MSSISVNFIHPKYGTQLAVDIDNEVTVAEIIENLISSGFVQKNEMGYQLGVMGQTDVLDKTKTFAELGIEDSDVIRVETIKPVKVGNVIYTKFMHPSQGLLLDVELDEKTTAKMALDMLLDKGFILFNPTGYALTFRHGTPIDDDQILGALDIEAGDIFQVIYQAAKRNTADSMMIESADFQEAILLLKDIKTNGIKAIRPKPVYETEPFESIASLVDEIKNLKHIR